MAGAPEFQIFVGSLPSDITEEELQFVFKAYGNVKSIRILKPEDRKGKGAGPGNVDSIAWVTYYDKLACEDAIDALNDNYKIREEKDCKPMKAILLFPGGAREACHGPTEKYQLFWPSQTDFVRLAARFNAIVVPFGSIGSADNVRIVEGKEVSEQDRKGFADMMEGQGMSVVSESLREPPRFNPSPPRLPPATQTAAGFGDRFYYSFGEPVDLADLDSKDKVGCQQMYNKLKGDVEAEIRWLLEARVRDPNRDFLKRQIKERVMNLNPVPKEVKAGPLKGNFIRSCGRRADTFPLE